MDQSIIPLGLIGTVVAAAAGLLLRLMPLRGCYVAGTVLGLAGVLLPAGMVQSAAPPESSVPWGTIVSVGLITLAIAAAAECLTTTRRGGGLFEYATAAVLVVLWLAIEIDGVLAGVCGIAQLGTGWLLWRVTREEAEEAKQHAALEQRQPTAMVIGQEAVLGTVSFALLLLLVLGPLHYAVTTEQGRQSGSRRLSAFPTRERTLEAANLASPHDSADPPPVEGALSMANHDELRWFVPAAIGLVILAAGRRRTELNASPAAHESAAHEPPASDP